MTRKQTTTRAIEQYPAKVQRGLQIINDSFNDDDSILDEQIKLPIAALRAAGFAAIYGSAGRPDQPGSESPWVDMESPKALYLLEQKIPSMPKGWNLDDDGPETQMLITDMQQANSEAEKELLALLEEFYNSRPVGASTRLIIKVNPDLGNFRLQCQDAETSTLLSKTEYPKRLIAAQKEMRDFAEFLCAKVQ